MSNICTLRGLEQDLKGNKGKREYNEIFVLNAKQHSKYHSKGSNQREAKMKAAIILPTPNQAPAFHLHKKAKLNERK